MAYQSIILELLQRHPRLHEPLRRSGQLLAATEALARDLKARREAAQARLLADQPDLDPAQSAAAAMEIALRQIEHRLHSACPVDDSAPFRLDDAMAFIRQPTSPD